MNSRSAITTTVGYMCLALAGWMLFMHDAGWYHHEYYSATVAIVFPLAFVLGVMGILAFIRNRTLDAIVFFGAAGYLWSRHLWIMTMHAGANAAASNYAWFFLVWAVFFFYVWLGSFQAGIVRFLFLLCMWLALLGHAIGDWGVHIVGDIGGYIGLISAILAAIISAEAVIANGRSVDGPNGEKVVVVVEEV